MYDLTSFLTTITAASASIVAILGGFIASKLISINSDRDSAIERLKQLEKELDVHKEERDKLQEENNAYDAIDFINDHITDLMSGKDLSDIYDESNRPSLSQEILLSYWKKASKIWYEFISSTKEKPAQLNDDSVPVALAQKYRDDDFGYNVCQEISNKYQEIKKAQEREKRKTGNDIMDAILTRPDFSDISPISPYPNNLGYSKNNDLIEDHNFNIKYLELQKKQLNEQINSLQKPKGMKGVLIIFAVFSVCCIILPLLLIPFSTENYSIYVALKLVFWGLFLGGLIAIFSYLVWLLNWKDNQKT